MPRLLAWTTSTLLLATCATAAAPQAQPAQAGTEAAAPARPARREVVRRILPHNVRVLTRVDGQVKRSASGVVIASEEGPDGRASYVVTNAHAVTREGAPGAALVVVVDGPRGEESEYPAEVLAEGEVPELDLALVRLRGVALPPARLAAVDELEVGEEVVVAAAPYGRRLSLSGGMVSQVDWDRATGAPRLLKTDAAIGYGSSGGGIFSRTSGHLLAVVEGYRTARVGFAVQEQQYSFDVPMPGETFAAPANKVRGFLRSRGFGQLLERAEAAAERAAPSALSAGVEARR
jgi:serine protease Do